MRRNKGPAAADTPLEAARKRVLQAVDVLGPEAMTGSVIFRRMSDRSAETETGAGRGIQPGDQSLLYPALHSLEADWEVQAAWVTDANGIHHRTYRKRRLLPRPGAAAPR